MDEQTKQIVGIGVGVGAIGVASVFGYWYYSKVKKQRELEELIETGEAEVAENYQDDRPILSKLKSALVNKLYPQDYKNLPRTQRDIKKDMEEYEKKHARRNRFTVFDSNRLQVLETMGDKGVEVRGTKRLRVSGNIHKRTEGGYNGNSNNRNNRNVNFADLGIF